MAVQPYPYLEMTDGTTTVTYADGSGGQTNWPPLREGWAPAIAMLRRSELGGVGPYDEVAEELEHNIRGATTAAALANLAAESRLLDQAERWWLRGEDVTPVLIKYAPQGSTIASTAAPLQTVVLGRALEDETNLNLSSRFNDVGMLREIQDVKARFLRRGRWLLAQESASSSGVTKPGVQTCTFASSAAELSPLTLEISGFTAGSADMQQGASMLLWAPAAADLTFLEAEGLVSGDFTSVAEATARGNNILRFTPTTTGVATTSQVVSAGIPTSVQRVDVYAMVRNNDTTKTYQIRARMFPLHSGNTNDIVDGPWVPIDGALTWARPIALGSFTTLSGWDVCFLEVIASATGGTLDIDYLVFQNRDQPLASGAAAIRVNSSTGYPGAYTLVLDDGALTWPTPTLYHKATGQTNKYLSYQGDIAANQIGSTVAAVWMSSSGTKFGQRNNADSNFVTTTITARRRPAYRSPQ